MKSLRLLINGRVQGVGYRDWLVWKASGLGLTGWVRNLGRDQVEAVLSGEDSAVDAALAACHRGPRAARVDAITTEDIAAPEMKGFVRRPTA